MTLLSQWILLSAGLLWPAPFGMRDCLVFPSRAYASTKPSRGWTIVQLIVPRKRARDPLGSLQDCTRSQRRSPPPPVFSLPCFNESHFLWGVSGGWRRSPARRDRLQQLLGHQKWEKGTWILSPFVSSAPRIFCPYSWAKTAEGKRFPLSPDCA